MLGGGLITGEDQTTVVLAQSKRCSTFYCFSP